MNPVLVELTRGAVVESLHRGALAVIDHQGKIFAAWGDIERPVFPRSAFKSLQALPLIESGAADAFGIGTEELALACASHSGEPFHIDRVTAWLKKIDCGEPDLACGPHLPLHEASAHRMLRDGEKPCRIHNNCSGKHTGFLTLARHLKAPIANYEHHDHPVQKRVREAIATTCGVDADTMPIGIDGCAAPNYAIPLKNLALAMARMGSGAGLTSDRAKAANRLIDAWKAHPDLVSGTGRACADLIASAKGKAVVKTGAEGVFMAIAPESGLGIALKMDDGATRGAETAMAQILVLFGLADPAAPRVQKHVDATIRNWRGDEVGRRRPAESLRALPNGGL